MSSDGGKGSAPRKMRNDEAYANNWELIFGKKQNGKSTSKDHRVQGTDPTGDRPDERDQGAGNADRAGSR